MSQHDTLEPCPFCGRTDLEVTHNGTATRWYMCMTCRAEGPAGDSDAEAIEAWNCRAALSATQPAQAHWTEREPVRLASSRVGRVYIAGPMTGIEEFNFPAFNAEAAKLRGEGMAVLNPAEHGIVDGAEWADYLRHDIAGLASCERTHMLRGWEKSKGAQLEVTIAQALGMQITYQEGAEPAQAAQSGNRPTPEWYARKIQETLDDDFAIGPAAVDEAQAAQPDGRGTDAQIEKERDIARHAIVGSLAAGYAGQSHPGADHWLAAAHEAGARIKDLEAQAAQGEPVRHIGDSKFESWYQAHPKANGGDKQLARDAYAAGMFDPVAQGAGEVVALPIFDDLDDEAIDVACTAGSIYRVDFMRAYTALRDWCPHYTVPAQPAAGADALKNAARYGMLRRGQHWSVINGIGDTLRGDALDAAADAALATHQQGGK